ncbi:MAG: InlB B-repeat-containing protein, partial [Bifidobacteriaceae bacterium]|nr:InlB B-repeat-containing protein [Bifidobacteriaceae bacterium]
VDVVKPSRDVDGGQVAVEIGRLSVPSGTTTLRLNNTSPSEVVLDVVDLAPGAVLNSAITSGAQLTINTLNRTGAHVTISPVSAVYPLLDFGGAALAQGTVGTAYSQTVASNAAGVGPLAFSLASGSTMPPGLTLQSDGTIEGTPATAGDYDIVVAVADPLGRTSTATYQLSVADTVWWSVRFEGNGSGVSGVPGPAVVLDGEAFTVPSAEPVRPGWLFGGWDTAQDGSGSGYGPGGVVASVTGDLVLWAQWAPVQPPTTHETLTHFGTFTGSGTRWASTSANHAGFIGLRLDGEAVDPANYATDGGDETTVVTLSEAYMMTLANGTYWFIADFIDGHANLRLIVDVPGPDEPGPDEPGPDEPGPDEPGPDEPGPDEPGPDEPGPDEPGPDEPGPDQPGPDVTGGGTQGVAGGGKSGGDGTSTVPVTGDSTNTTAPFACLVVGLVGLAVTLQWRRRQCRRGTW